MYIYIYTHTHTPKFATACVQEGDRKFIFGDSWCFAERCSISMSQEFHTGVCCGTPALRISALAATLAEVWDDVKCWKERLQQVQHRFFQDPGGKAGQLVP